MNAKTKTSEQTKIYAFILKKGKKQVGRVVVGVRLKRWGGGV